MPNPEFLGYLNNPYLDSPDPYLGDTGLYSWGMEVSRQIVDKNNPVAMEILKNIVDRPNPIAMEISRTIESTHILGMETNLVALFSDSNGMEVHRQITDFLDVTGSEAQLVLQSSDELGMEVARSVQNFLGVRGMEVNRFLIDQKRTVAMEIRLDQSLASWLCEELGYLGESYLGGSYLAPGICAQLDGQVLRLISLSTSTGMEVNKVINSSKTRAMEVLRRIVDEANSVAMSANRLQSIKLGMQTRLVLYNTTQLRILCDFPSRGTTGTNWTASSTGAGDFSVNNLNTDIVEQRWQSAAATTSAVLTCDTEIVQGTPVDTVAILNHNFSSSASIVVEGSNNPAFAPVQETFAMLPTKTNSYYIAPTFPTLQSRYWRFIISDPTNSQGVLKVGTIVFGTTVIFQGECFTDNVVRRNRHFADKVATEGFTNVSNDRALKRSVALEFRNLGYNRGNFKNIVEVFDYARTSLKCLWIPDPKDPGRFAVFGKLLQIPDETHNNLGPDASDTVDFSLEVDESQ